MTRALAGADIALSARSPHAGGQPPTPSDLHPQREKTSMPQVLILGNRTPNKGGVGCQSVRPLLEELLSPFMVSIWCPLLQGKGETGENAMDREESRRLSHIYFILFGLISNSKIW